MAGLSKLEYLKKYMDGGDKTEVVKKKRRKVKRQNIKIIDYDITFKDLNTVSGDEYDLQEEKPLLFAVDGTTLITKEYEENEKYRKSKWAPLESTSKNIQLEHGNNLPRKRHDSSGSDVSPVRNPVRKPRKRHDSSESDLSPVRDSNLQNSDSDLSPVRKHDTNTGDLSPPRKHQSYETLNSNKQTSSGQWDKKHSRKEELPVIMSTGGKAGLRTGAELRLENENKRKQEKQLINNMKESGKGAETVYRDHKSGKKIDVKFEELKKRREEEKRLQENEKYATWGKGVTQEDNYQKQLQNDLREMEKPLARYKNDEDLDLMLKEQDRAGDPMLKFLTKNKSKQQKSNKPRYNGPAPAPNRFNIQPGYRYDGVDRSNGFEKKRFMEMSKRKSLKEDAYKWSVEDM